ncbi:MAG: Long-chain-fatty-acid--CoA ligase [Candidatus Magnetoglobus multicellularis str. Araruama]|uniref:Long-chain-fatty-acid--CoA ligase n=1 Tax=Candidatus Magnetoglobus multicellularis str. Araruama TaxID=890399 RepID=A0A1V1PCI3_9BACT|nr:MAG: Long-chain-fatty-acid--CoA ligase [Candidatus Magnetoglobus multicellularis str. Araruama]
MDQAKEKRTESQVTYKDHPWKKHYSKHIPSKMDFKEMYLPSYLQRSVQNFPDKAALIFQGYVVTYKELQNMVDRFASCLKAFGIQKGDSVAILLPNTIQCVVSYYAIVKLGAIVVMNNPLYADPELEHQFNDSGAKVLITLDLLANRMIDLRPKTNITQIVYTSLADYMPFPKNFILKTVGKTRKISDWFPGIPFIKNIPIVGAIKSRFGELQNLTADVNIAPDVYNWKELLAQYEPDTSNVQLNNDDVVMYQYTGGTTGVSKGVMLTHGNITKQLQQASIWFPELEDGKEVVLGALPFFHVFGLTTVMNFSICKGWTNILIPKPQADQLLDTIHNYRPTFTPLVPTMFINMLNHPDIKKTDMTSIKACFSGSAPLAVDIIHEFEKMTGAVIIEGFGMTESSPVTHMNPFDGIRKVGSVGIPIPETECRIVDLETGEKDTLVGQPGELIVKGPQVMKGYKNRPDETAKTLRDGWLYTGDIATMDEDGYFYIVDRKKDMIISGGFNVYPRDIDEAIYEHPKVQEACSIGIPHSTRGEAVKVFVVLKENETATENEIIDFCKPKLAKYKWPVEVEFRKELPKTNVGKILRKDLRKQEIARRE